MTKKNLLSGIVGTVVYYLLGWLVYGLILTDKSSGESSLTFIFLGCLFYAFTIAYIYAKLAQISSLKAGFNAGVVIGVLFSLSWYFFMYAEFNIRELIEEVIVGGLMTGILGGVIAFVNKKIG